MTTDAQKFIESLDGPLSLGETLNSIRCTEGYTLATFSKKINISVSHLCDIEKSRKVVFPARAARFAKKLGYPQRVFIELSIQDILRSEKLKYKVTLEPLRVV